MRDKTIKGIKMHFTLFERELKSARIAKLRATESRVDERKRKSEKEAGARLDSK